MSPQPAYSFLLSPLSLEAGFIFHFSDYKVLFRFLRIHLPVRLKVLTSVSIKNAGALSQTCSRFQHLSGGDEEMARRGFATDNESTSFRICGRSVHSPSFFLLDQGFILIFVDGILRARQL